jgi:undecaprenyl-diphosphatase
MDKQLFILLSDFSGHSYLFDQFIYFCAVVLPWFVVVIFVAWILSKRNTDIFLKGLLILFLTIVAWFFSSFFKYAYFSPRPFMEIFQNKPLFTMEVWWDSLPSGHTVFFASLAGASVLLKNKYLSIILWVIAVVIGLSRVIAGVHWPSDVLVGLLLGGFLGFGLARFFSRVFHLN